VAFVVRRSAIVFWAWEGGRKKLKGGQK
jgi:hypothetical protein